jgi:hypothetical protein
VGFIHAMGMDLYLKHFAPLEGNSEEEKKSSTWVREISTNIQDEEAKTPLKPHIEKTFTTISDAKKHCKFSEERVRK